MQDKKLIAPIIITVFLVIILMSYFFIWSIMPIPFIIKILLLFVALALVAVAGYNLYERILEIRSGEEDDLSKY
ncbi:hypothetical protein AALC25_13970 [Lachnospiraceae bacterium 29-84]